MSTQPETMTPQQLRESLLTELEASQQALAELSDEELLEAIMGGGACCSKMSRTPSARDLETHNVPDLRIESFAVYHSALNSSPASYRSLSLPNSTPESSTSYHARSSSHSPVSNRTPTPSSSPASPTLERSFSWS